MHAYLLIILSLLTPVTITMEKKEKISSREAAGFIVRVFSAWIPTVL
jgi:hypothetical protein